MLPLPRLARPTTAVGRAYSSFFSSKPGGGRHFVSAKPPKPVLQPGRARAENTTTIGPPTESATTTTPSANATHVVKTATVDEKSPSKPAETHLQSSAESPPYMYPSSTSNYVPIHPVVSSKEYKLHQFFSLHRPLLLLNQTSSSIFEAAGPSTSLFTSSEDPVNTDSQHAFPTIDNPPESSPDADADAARQLAHSLVANRVGGALAWERVLSQLGLNARCSQNDISQARDSAHEWVNIHADSTRRKKRKKMKKHKLKKRRRLTRRQNK